MKIKYRLYFSSLICASLLSCLATGAETKGNDGKLSSPFSEKLAGFDGNEEREAAFLALMTKHHRDGIKMGELVPERAKSEKLKEMVRKSDAQQKKEIEQMTTWLKQWHQKAPDEYKKPEEAEKKMDKDIAELKEVMGEEFDKLFTEKFARHHVGSIEMSRLVLDKAEHDEVKELARKLIESQTKQRKELLEMHERKESKTEEN